MAGTCCNPFLGFGMVGYCVGFTFFIVGLVTRNWMVPIQSGDNALLGLFQWCTIDGHCITLGSSKHFILLSNIQVNTKSTENTEM